MVLKVDIYHPGSVEGEGGPSTIVLGEKGPQVLNVLIWDPVTGRMKDGPTICGNQEGGKILNVELPTGGRVDLSKPEVPVVGERKIALSTPHQVFVVQRVEPEE